MPTDFSLRTQLRRALPGYESELKRFYDEASAVVPMRSPFASQPPLIRPGLGSSIASSHSPSRFKTLDPATLFTFPKSQGGVSAVEDATKGFSQKGVKEIVEELAKPTKNAAAINKLSDVIDLKKTMGSMGAYAGFGILGLDLLASKEKTPALFGGGGAAAAYLLTQKSSWQTRLIGSIAAYATGRFLGSALTKRGLPEIEGFSDRGVSGHTRRQNFDHFKQGEDISSQGDVGAYKFKESPGSYKTLPRARTQLKSYGGEQQWADSTINVKQPHRGSFTVGSDIQSMHRQHAPPIRGLYENGMAASERHISTEFGSGWLSRVFRAGSRRGARRQAGMSSALHEILTTGGATGKDFANTRMSGERAQELIKGFLTKEKVELIEGREQLKGVISRKYAGASEEKIQAAVEDISSAGAAYSETLGAVYITTDAVELAAKVKTLPSTKSGLKPGDSFEDIKARLLGHETLEYYFTKANKKKQAIGQIASHQTPQIYRAEAELSSMLGERATEYTVQRRTAEISRLTSEISKGIEVDLLEASQRGLDTGGKMNRLIDPQKRVHLSYLRKSLSETKAIYKQEKVLSKASLGQIEATERIIGQDLAQHAQRVEQISDNMASGLDRNVIRRYAQAAQRTKESRRRVVPVLEAVRRQADEQEVLLKRKYLGKINAEAEVQEAVNTRNSISRANQSRNVPGLAQTGQAAELHRKLGYHSGIDPFRKYLASIGKNFNEVRGNVHFQRAIKSGTVLETIGEGGVGSVAKMEANIPPEALGLAADHVGSIPKLKYLRKGYHDSFGEEFAFNSMRAEAKGLKAIEDTLGPSVYGTLENQNSPYIFMEHIEDASTLKDYLKKGKKLPKKTYDKIKDGLDKMHEQGLAHGDFSAKNILINNQGQPFIIDPMPARLAPGGSMAAVNSQSRALLMAQDQVGVEQMARLVDRRFAVAAEASTAADRLQLISNAPTLDMINPTGWLNDVKRTHGAGEVAFATDVLDDIHRRAKRLDAGGSFPFSGEAAGEASDAMNATAPAVPKGVKKARKESREINEALEVLRRENVHFNDKHQRLMQNAQTAARNVGNPNRPGNRHRSMDSHREAFENVLERVETAATQR